MKKLKLGNDPHMKSLFEANLNYKWIITLYGVLGGNANLNEINPVNLPVFVRTVGQIIGSGDPVNQFYGAHYVGSYAKDVVLGNGDEILSKEEQEVIKIYEDKLIDMSIISHLREFYNILGYTLSPTGLNPEDFALITGGVGVGGYLFANYNIKKGIQKGKIPLIKGLLLKRLSFAAIILGAAVGTVSYFGRDKLNHTFESSLAEALEKGDKHKIKSLIQTHKMSLKTYNTHSGEKFHVYSYPGEPVMLFYKQKLYFPTLVEGTEEKEWLGKGKELAQAAIATFTSSGENKTRRVEKKKINTQITSMLGEKITIGEGSHSEHMSISDIQVALRDGNNKQSYQAHTEIARWLEDVILESKYDVYFSNNAPTKYYPIKPLGDGKILALKEAGEIQPPGTTT